jgi:hypothetical protein
VKPEDLIALALRNTATIRKCWPQRQDKLVRYWLRDWFGELRYARYMFNRLSESARDDGLQLIRHDLHDLTLEIPHVLNPSPPRLLRHPPQR